MTKARDLADLLDASGNIIAQGTIDGRDLASDGSKLDGIESGATADQTPSEIRALIVDGVDTNVFTDADHTKLDGIEANATADQTASEIRALVESATDSNVFTDADHTKLNAIESGATADQTKADIDALNIDADTLDGQHGSYYTGYTDTAVANLVDSAPGTLDTLNELAAALGDDPNFATTTATNIGTKANKTITVSAGSGLTGGGDLTANRTISHADTSSVSDVNGSGNTFIQDIGFDTYGHVTSVGTGTVTVGDGAMTVTAGSGLTGGGQLGTANQSGASSISLSVTDAPKWTTARTLSLSGDASGSVSWDGSGNATLSVAVADDSHSHSNYVQRDYQDSSRNLNLVTNSTSGAGGIVQKSSSGDFQFQIYGDGSAYGFLASDWGNWDVRKVIEGQMELRVGGANYTVFHSGNDGSGSGLDADLLDGRHMSATRNEPYTIPVRDGSGYLQLGWINTTSGDTSSTLSRIYVDTGDGYIRKCTPAHLASQLGGGINVQSVSGTSPTLNVGSFNTFTQDLTANTSISFSNIPTKAKWSYYYYTGNDTNAFSTSGLGADGVAQTLDNLGPASGNLGSIVSANTTNWLSICSSVYGLGNGNLNVENLALKEDGTILIIQTYNNSVTYFKRFNMSTPFDLSTLSYDAARSGSITLQSTSANRKGDLNGYGYWQQNQNAYSTINTEGVGQYRFTTPWDASTVTGQEFVNFWATSSYSYHSWWGNSGSYYYHVDGSSRIWRYNCSTAYDIRTITGNSGAQNVTDGPYYDTLNGVMSADGTKFYYLNNSSSAIVIKDVTQWQPWTSISTKQEFGAVSGNYNRGYNCNSAGYMTFIANNAIIIASLAASYDLSVPSIGATFGGAADTYSRVDFFTSDGGTNIYANAVYNGSKG